MQFVRVFLMSEPCNIFKVFVRCLYMTAGSCVLFTSNQHLGLLPFLSIYARWTFLLATVLFSCTVFVCLPNKVTAADVSVSFLCIDCFKRLVEWLISDEHCQIEKMIVAETGWMTYLRRTLSDWEDDSRLVTKKFLAYFSPVKFSFALLILRIMQNYKW